MGYRRRSEYALSLKESNYRRPRPGKIFPLLSGMEMMIGGPQIACSEDFLLYTILLTYYILILKQDSIPLVPLVLHTHALDVKLH